MRNATMPRKRRLLLCKVRGAPRRAKAEPELLLKSADISPTSQLAARQFLQLLQFQQYMPLERWSNFPQKAQD